ncbi:MAG: single-stranded-DNA-specific exonuclease RecJ [Thermodesulfovibrionales bacterium]
MNRRWFINRTNPEYINYLSRAVSISPILAQVLINRGIKTPDGINDFLHSGITSLSDPSDLPDMDVAVERIKNALSRNERVLVHGDYDTDGLTATAIMVHALRTIGMDVHYFIPNRMVHGYGFNPSSVDAAEKLGVKLIITVDCGIASFDAAAYAKGKGIDVIITDHHEPVISNEKAATSDELRATSKGYGVRYSLPYASAVINPKLKTDDYRLSVLSGAGIALKVVQALSMQQDMPISHDDFLSLLDLAALGTVADIVPLIGENRVILKEGLRYIHDAYRPGIRSLKEVSGLSGRDIKAELLSFTMVPRINAAGRLNDARDVIRLFLSDSIEESLSIAESLDRTNSERQRIEEEVYQEALSQLNTKGYDTAIVLYKEGWHMGVIGIVASRIAEEFYRPTFVFSIEGYTAKGSARSIPPFDIYKGLSACQDTLLSYGGHKQAAGINLYASNLSVFEEKINNIAKETLRDEDFIPSIEIDAEATLSVVSADLIRELSMLEPLGHGNPGPLLGARRLDVLNPRIVGNNHLKMTLRQTQGRQRALSIDAIGFDMGELLKGLDSVTSIDAAFTPTINEWNGGRYLQLNLKALRPSL